MNTIFPAPGTITSTNSYIVDWYINDPSFLRYPTLVKQQLDLLSIPVNIPESNVLDTYNNSIIGEYSYTILSQSLPASTTSSTTSTWYAFDFDKLTYSTTQPATIKLYFDNQFEEYVPFKKSSSIRIINSNTGYKNTFAVLDSSYDSVTIAYVNVTLSGSTIDSTVDTVYRQSQIINTLDTASLSRKNLFYSSVKRSAILDNVSQPTDISTTVNKLSAAYVIKEIVDNRAVLPIKQYKVPSVAVNDLLPDVINLSQNDSLVYGDYKFDIINQTLINSTINSSTVRWYLNEENIMTYTNNVSNTLSVFFNNYSNFIPFKTASTIRISSRIITKTYTVLAGFKDYVIIESDVFNADGAVIDNIKSTLGLQNNTFKELGVASLPRKNLFFSLMAKGFTQSSITPPVSLSTVTNQFTAQSLKSAIVVRSVVNPTTPTTITNLNIKNVINYWSDTDVKQLDQYNSEVMGEYRFRIINQTLPSATVNSNTVNWYIFENSVLTYSLSNSPTINIYFDNNNLSIPFKTNSTVRIRNSLTGYSNLFTVILGKSNYITIQSDIFLAEGAYIDSIVTSIGNQDLTNQEYNIASIPRKNLMVSAMSPGYKPSIVFKDLGYSIIIDKVNTETLNKPLHKLTCDNADISSDIINKFNTTVIDSNTSVISNSLEVHSALFQGDYSFTVIETKPLRFKTVNSSTVNWYIYEQNTISYNIAEYTGDTITVFFNNAITGFSPFKPNSLIRISDSYNYSSVYTVLSSTVNSVTINAIEIPLNTIIDNITETVYNQTYTHLLLPNVSDSIKKLYYSRMATGFTAPNIESLGTSNADNIIQSGKISRELTPVTSVSSQIQSFTVNKQLFTVKSAMPLIKSESFDTYRANDVISSSIDQPRSLSPYDSLEDGTTIGVLGQPLTYNVVNWYIEETNILTKSSVNNSITTLVFENLKIWKIFLVNQYVRIKQPSANFSMDILVIAATLNSISFESVVGFPTNYSGMTISHLYSPIYSQSLVNVNINPPNLTTPRENLAAGSNSMFVNMFPIGKTIYNSRGTFAIINPTVQYDTVQLPIESNLLNSYDNLPDGFKYAVIGQPIRYNVVSWYTNEFDNRLIRTQNTVGSTITLVFENVGADRPFKINETVKIQQLNSSYSVSVTVIASSSNSITFSTVVGFPTNYSGLQLIRLYSSVLPQLSFDQEFSNVNNPTDLDKPQKNLALLSNPAFINLFPIGKMYNTRGTSAFSLTPQMASTSIDTPKCLTPYETLEDGLMTDVVGQPIYYDVVNWYLNDSDNRLLGTAVSLPTITLIYTYLGNENPFIGQQIVRIKQSSTNYSVDVLITRSTANSITFNTVPGFPTNYSGLTIYRLNSPVFYQKDVHIELNPYNLTLPREQLAASLFKPNPSGTYVTYFKGELLGDIRTPEPRGKMDTFNELKIPGDFDCEVISTSLYSFTANTNAVSWYTLDNDILSYSTQTTNYIKLQFKELEFIPFKTNTNIKLVSSTTIITPVITGTTSYVIVEYNSLFVWTNVRIQQELSTVYPLDYASTTVSPVTPRERLYFTRIKSSSPLYVVFNQGEFTTTDVSTVSNPVISLKTVEPKRNVNSIKVLPKITGISVNLNSQLVNTYKTDTTEIKSKLPVEQLSNINIIKGETTDWNSGLLSKFKVSKISEIGRETVLTVSKIMPIQFWN